MIVLEENKQFFSKCFDIRAFFSQQIVKGGIYIAILILFSSLQKLQIKSKTWILKSIHFRYAHEMQGMNLARASATLSLNKKAFWQNLHGTQ